MGLPPPADARKNPSPALPCSPFFIPATADLSQKVLKDQDGNIVPYEQGPDSRTIRFIADIGKCSTMGYTLSDGTPATPRKLTFAVRTSRDLQARGKMR